MNIDALLQKYKEDARILRIAEKIGATPPQNLHLTGLVGSAEAFVAGDAIIIEDVVGVEVAVGVDSAKLLEPGVGPVDCRCGEGAGRGWAQMRTNVNRRA